MTLDKVRAEQVVKISQINGGWGIRQRLNQLGLFVGGQVKIKRCSCLGGPLLLEFNNSMVAIGRGMAAHITIEKDESQNKI